MSQKKSTPEILDDLYLRTLCRKPTALEVDKLTAIVESNLGNPTRVSELAAAQARGDQNYRRAEEQLAKLKTDYDQALKDGKDAPVLTNLQTQIQTQERQLAATRQRYEGNAPLLVYSDILWGLFNSTEFAFNH